MQPGALPVCPPVMGAWSCGCPKSPFRPPDRPLSSWGPGPPHGGDPSIPSPKSAGWKQGREHRDSDPMGDPVPGGVWVCPILGAVGGGAASPSPLPKALGTNWSAAGPWAHTRHGCGVPSREPQSIPSEGHEGCTRRTLSRRRAMPRCGAVHSLSNKELHTVPHLLSSSGSGDPGLPCSLSTFPVVFALLLPTRQPVWAGSSFTPREQPGRAGCAEGTSGPGGFSGPIPRGAVPSPGPSWQHPQGQHPGVPHCPPRELPWKSQAGFWPGLSLLGNKLVRCGISSVLPNPGSIHCAAAARLLTALIGGNKKQCFLEGKPSVGLSTPASRNTHHGSLITQGLRMPRLTRC